ncbi:MAG: hypothetical protein R2712_25705 [Vicinamibacterales bacterium]
MVNALLFRQTAIADTDRMVEIYSSAGQDIPQFVSSYPDFLDMREGVTALAGIAGHGFVRGVITIDDRPVLATGEAVTDGYFEVLGVHVPLRTRDQCRGQCGDRCGARRRAEPRAVAAAARRPRRHPGAVTPVERRAVHGDRRRTTGLRRHDAGAGARVLGPGRAGGSPERRRRHRHRGTAHHVAARGEPRGTLAVRQGTPADQRTITDVRAQIDTIFARLRADHPVTNDKTTASVVPATSFRFHPMLDGYVRAASASSWAPSAWCCSWRAPTWRACCSRGRGAAAGDGRAHGRWRRTRAARPPDADREPGARGGRRRPRHGGRGGRPAPSMAWARACCP